MLQASQVVLTWRFWYLGQVLTHVEYTHIKTAPYFFTIFPGLLTIPPLTSQHTSSTMRETHQALIRIFCKVIEIEKAVAKNIIIAINLSYVISNFLMTPLIELLKVVITDNQYINWCLTN